MRANNNADSGPNHTRRLAWAAVICIAGAALVVLTIELADETQISFLRTNRNRIVAAEIALLGILAIELVGSAVLRHFRRRDALQLGIGVRAALRAAGYIVLGVTIVSLLSANPAVALGVGGVTGIIVGFAVQNIVGNMFAGIFLAFGRLFKIGDRVTVAGSTGHVVEISLIYTVIDAGDRWVFVPSSVLMSNAVQRLKEPGAQAPPEGSVAKQGAPESLSAETESKRDEIT